MKTYSIALALAVVLCPAWAQGQTQTYSWTTVAGQAGVKGSADGTNTAATFNGPVGIAFDKAGSLYVSDQFNHTIRKLTLSGTNWVTTTIAGLPGEFGSNEGTNSDVRFTFPAGLVVDSEGHVYVAESGYNYRIRKLSPVGNDYVSSTVAGTPFSSGSEDGINLNARFGSPYGVALDTFGTLFVTDFNDTIRKITRIGSDWLTTTIAGVPGLESYADGTNNNARFDLPTGITLDGAGNVYVADGFTNIIRSLTQQGPDWVVRTIAGLAGPPGYADGINSDARFTYPFGLATDASGNLFVTDATTIRKITHLGTNWVTITVGGLAGQSGSIDGTNSDARFTGPRGITVDNNGNLYVTEYTGHVIRKGSPVTVAPAPPGLNGVTHTKGVLTFTWTASAGQTYQLQYTSDLTSTDWTNLGNAITATNGMVSASDVMGANRQRFYRVMMLRQN